MGVKVQFRGTMKWSPSCLRRRGRTSRRAAPALTNGHIRPTPRTTSGFPQPGAVLFEIGVMLGIHLAVALAVTLILRASGIV